MGLHSFSYCQNCTNACGFTHCTHLPPYSNVKMLERVMDKHRYAHILSRILSTVTEFNGLK